ncbi:MAG: response regulator [Hahellaceae bacterium]|nr:response regulator [Hahellaceae bacterium]
MITREYRNTRFLIVDSQLEGRLLIERRLKALGAWFIDSAVDGPQAIERCDKGLFDVVICEYHLEGRNGQHVLEELRERHILNYTAVFIMVSAETTREMVLSAIDHQPDAYITKPIAEDVLQQRLDTLLIDGEALYNIRHAMDMKRHSEAINLCEDKIFKGSKYARWCEKTVADLYFRTKSYDDALRTYQRVLSEKPLIWAQIGIARVYLVMEDYAKAEVQLANVLNVSSNCLVAHDLMAELLVLTGRSQEAQSLLTGAVSKSPTAIRRHARLGEVCVLNNDVDSATEAYRNAVRLGEFSIFNKPENHVGFARALAEKSESMPMELRARHAQEALEVLDKAAATMSLSDTCQFQKSVVDAKLHHRLRDKASADQSLSQAESLYQRIGIQLESRDSLEFAEALLNSGKDTEAESILTHVMILHGTDANVVKRIADIREEPVSTGAKQRAAELNKEGIQAVDRDDMKEAIQIFSEALDYSPRHPALNLNMVQVIIKYVAAAPAESHLLETARQCLHRLGNMAESHRQYARYQHLKKKLNME